jgi:hypothetical protein
MASLQCRSCGSVVSYDEPIPRDSECDSCGRDLRCCRNCRHYDPAYNNACRETEADVVEDKARRNFCEFFQFDRAPFVPAAMKPASEARAKLESLFGGAGAPPDATRTAREKLDALFEKRDPPRDREADARRKLDALFDKRGTPRERDSDANQKPEDS